MARDRQYSQSEEKANALSHALGIVMGIAAGFLLLNAVSTNSWAVLSVWVYLFGMMASYITSTWYHGTTNPERKRILQKLDHASIYLHIAGSYTPFTLVTLRNEGWWGWGIFLFVWIAAIVGVALSFRRHDKHSHLETACYVIMGCSILIALNPLLDALSVDGKTSAFYYLVGGGVSYVVGALFYSWRKVKYMHTVFHFFVLGGSICHILAIFTVVSQ